MSVQSLDIQKFLLLQKFSTRDLFDNVYTSYDNIPSELQEIENLETLARSKVSQITPRLGIGQLVAPESVLFTVPQPREITALQQIAISDNTLGASDSGGGSNGDGGGGGG